MKKFLQVAFALIVFSGFSWNLQAAAVHFEKVYSPSMDKKIDVVCITPDVMAEGVPCPVLYLLHGYSGDHVNWLEIKPDLPRLADLYGLIIVTPDGANSWYWDSPIDPKSKYETFVAKELVAYVDSHFKTIADREHRAITGLSMGGHGGMWLGIRHQDVYGACGSMSGGLDIRPFPEKWEMKKQLGELEGNEKRWDDYTVINQLHLLEDKAMAIIFDCGVDDFFYEVNKNVHNQLVERKITHDFIERPGKHNGKYWNNSIEYQLLFFHRFFEGYRFVED